MYIEIEWIGTSGWNPDVGNVEKGKLIVVTTELADKLIEQGQAKLKDKKKKGGK